MLRLSGHSLMPPTFWARRRKADLQSSDLAYRRSLLAFRAVFAGGKQVDNPVKEQAASILQQSYLSMTDLPINSCFIRTTSVWLDQKSAKLAS